MTGFNLSNATPEAREGFFHALRLHAAGKDERRTYERVQLAKEGDWPTGGPAGGKPFTRETFDAILASADAAVPTVGISHKQPEPNGLNGTPSLAPIHNLEVDKDPATGKTALYGDLIGLPVWAAEEYPRRSVELMVYPDGRTVFTRLALLGDEAAAIPDLDPMPDGAQLVAAAAVVGRIADTTSPDGAEQPSPNGPEHIEQEEPGMSLDPKLVARSLGLPEDTPVDEINKAAEERAKDLVAEAEKVTETEAVIETEQPTEETPAVTASAEEPKTVTVDKAVFDALVAKAERGENADKRLDLIDAEQITAAAIIDGKILPATKDAYVADLTSDNETRRNEARILLTAAADQGGFPAQRVAPTGEMVGHGVTAAATAAQGDDDAFYEAVYGKEA